MTRIVVQQPEVYVVTVGEAGPRGEQGPAGVSSGEAANLISAQSGEATTMFRGTPVAFSGGLVVRASASGPGKLYGLVSDATILAGGFGQILTGTVLTGTTDEWDTITNSVGGLIPHSTYFLSTTAGRITTTPSLASSVLTRVGYALSSTKLRLMFDSPITL